MSDLTVLDKNNFAAMAEAMGMNADTTKSSGSTLARLAIDTKGVFGETSVKDFSTSYISRTAIKNLLLDPC